MTSNFSSKSISALVLLDSDLLSFAWCPQGACRGLTVKVGDQTSCQRFDRWPRLECSAIHVSDTWEVQYKYGVHQLTPGKCTSSVKPPRIVLVAERVVQCGVNGIPHCGVYLEHRQARHRVASPRPIVLSPPVDSVHHRLGHLIVSRRSRRPPPQRAS